MLSNIRAKPIEGHVSDSAGNVLRNASIVIKQTSPTGSFVVDSAQSDDDGYFITRPIQNGTYDIYESGIRISRIIHSPDSDSIQCFQAGGDNFDLATVGNFNVLLGDHIHPATTQMNNYRGFIQIEPESTDVFQFGNVFPIYDFDLTNDPGNTEATQVHDLFNLSKFFGFNVNSRVTLTRFDVEYFSPLTSSSTTYKRVRWAGVPGIRFYQDSKIVIPLDYYSIVPSYPKVTLPVAADAGSTITVTELDLDHVQISDVGPATNIYTLSSLVGKGDIVKFKIQTASPTDPLNGQYWFGIVYYVSPQTSNAYILLERLRSSRVVSPQINETCNALRLYAYDGMFSNIMDISDEVNQRFTVTENISAQGNDFELYNYDDVIGS